jgi:hypothetical protein
MGECILCPHTTDASTRLLERTRPHVYYYPSPAGQSSQCLSNHLIFFFPSFLPLPFSRLAGTLNPLQGGRVLTLPRINKLQPEVAVPRAQSAYPPYIRYQGPRFVPGWLLALKKWQRSAPLHVNPPPFPPKTLLPTASSKSALFIALLLCLAQSSASAIRQHRGLSSPRASFSASLLDARLIT